MSSGLKSKRFQISKSLHRLFPTRGQLLRREIPVVRQGVLARDLHRSRATFPKLLTNTAVTAGRGASKATDSARQSRLWSGKAPNNLLPIRRLALRVRQLWREKAQKAPKCLLRLAASWGVSERPLGVREHPRNSLFSLLEVERPAKSQAKSRGDPQDNQLRSCRPTWLVGSLSR